MSTTIIRVKRRFEDDPVEALVLSYKRKKTEDDANEQQAQALLTFTATLDEKDDEATAKALNLCKPKNKLTESYKTHITDISGKQRQEKFKQIKENRFKILSLNRSIDAGLGGSQQENNKPMYIVDVGVDADTQNQERNIEPKYVYDLYSTDFMLDTEAGDFADGYFETLVSVQPFSNELIQYTSNEDPYIEDPFEDDSNDESNWRNDYPDSDHSVNDDDMRLAASLYGMGIDDGVDLSSDSEDERFLALTGESPPRGYDAYKKRVLCEWKRNKLVEVESEAEDDDQSDQSELS